MISSKFLITASLFALSAGAYAAPGLKELRQADKIALVTTGKPLQDADRQAFLKGDLSLEQLAEKLTKSPDFMEYFAQYWVKVLGFQGPVDVKALKPGEGTATLATLTKNQAPGLSWASNPALLSEARLNGVLGALEAVVIPEVTVKQCADGPMIVYNPNPGAPKPELLPNAAVNGIGFDGLPILPNTQEAWIKLRDFYSRAIPDCTATTPTVVPWWDPKEVTAYGSYRGATSYRVSSFVLEKCGPGLLKCNIVNAPIADSFTYQINKDVTMEPGYIISHNVATDRKFTEILTATDTIMTGTYGAFLSTFGKDLWPNFPKGGFVDAEHAIFKSKGIEDSKHYRIQRNELHAGVLTTPAYQILTNGQRAKANKAYETFLCRKFVVPQGIQPNPADNDPDLTKRDYCSACHLSLEPMAAFWNRWPQVGNINYRYNSVAAINDTGSFNGQSGKGVAAFGKILSETESFAECSVSRAYEFIYGRKMSHIEAENELPALVTKFNTSDKKLRVVLKDMLLAPEFLNALGE